MKKLLLLLIVCMVSMLALAQTNVTLTPATHDFGTIAVHFAYQHVFVLTNNGQSSISITSITASPNLPFSVHSTTCLSTLAGEGAHCDITVQAKADSPGAKSGMLTVDCSARACPLTSTLTATAMADATLTPTSYYFGALQLGFISRKTFTLTNYEPVALSVDEIQVVQVGGDYYFLLQSTDCGSSVPANSRCSITVEFIPEEVGLLHGTLTVTDNSPDGTPPVVPLSGTGFDM